MEDFEKHYWWHKGKLDLLKSLHENYVEKRQDLEILEIGCGTGEVLKLLDKWGNVTGVDFSQEAVDACRKRGFKNLICGDVNEIDFKGKENSFDLVVCLDVLEHIQDDVKTMKITYKLLKPGGIFIVAVPAYKFLWSTHDEALHHRRRYHSLEIKQKIKDSGFKLLKHTHFVALLFFPIAAVRLMSNFVRRTAYPKTHYVPISKKLNDLFSYFLKIESKLIEKLYLPFGTTLVVVAKKDD